MVLVSTAWVLGAPAASAQSPEPPAVLAGVVTDPSGARIPHASIHIHGHDFDRDTASNATGSFSATLPSSTYTVTVNAPGFRELTRDEIIAPGEYDSLTLQMSIDVAAEEISIDPWISSAESANALNFSGKQLEILSDDPETLRQELVAMAGGGTGIAAPQFYIDGFSNGQVPPKSAIRSIHINSNPYSTVYDHPGFGRVEIETQAGGNQLHGMLDFGGTDSAFNSNNPELHTVEPPYFQLLFRGNVSGPIGKKTSYFIAGNTSDLQNNAIVNATSPDAPYELLSVAVPNPLRDDNYSFRLDHRFSNANQMNGRYEIHRLNQTNAGVGLLLLPTEGYANNSTTQTLQLSDNDIVSQKVVNDIRFQYMRTRVSQNPNSTLPTLIVQGEFAGGGTPTQSLRDNQDQYEFQENVSIDRGHHFMRAGLRYRMFRDSSNSRAGYNGEYIFPNLASYQAGTPTQFSQTAGNSSAALSTGDLGVYAEDEWKVSRTFTLNYGLRYESQSAIPDHNDPAPRVGFAWTLMRKNAKMPFLTLRGGTGLFYQRLTASDLLPSVRQNGVNQVAYFVQNPGPNCYAPLSTTPPAGCLLAATEPTIYRVAPSFKTSRTIVSSLTAERAIGRIGSITANYLEADGRHQYVLLNANAPLPGTGVRPLGDENIYQFTSEGTGHEQMFFSNLNLMPRRWISLFGFYVAQRDHSDANGPTSFASNSYDIRQDYGRDDSDIGQQFFMGGSINLPHGLALQPFLAARSGRPFNITIGDDPNGDTIYNDRPAFATDLSRPSVVRTAYGNFDTDPLPSQTLVPYNYGIGPALFWFDLQANETIHIGRRPALKASAARSGKAGSAPAHKPERPWTLSFSVEAQNLFNHNNPSTPVGVLSPQIDPTTGTLVPSRLFGHPLSIATDFSSLTAANRSILLHSTFTF
jgi:hypothetical protein